MVLKIGPAQRDEENWARRLKMERLRRQRKTCHIFTNLLAYYLILPSPALKCSDLAQPGPEITQFGPVRPRLPIAYGQEQPQPGARPPMARALPIFLNLSIFLTFGPAQAACGLWAAPAQARARPGLPMARASPNIF